MAAKRKVKRLKGSPKLTPRLVKAAGAGLGSGGLGQAGRALAAQVKKNKETLGD